MKVLVTGANGFVGKAVCEYLAEKDINVIAAVRKESSAKINFTENNIHTAFVEDVYSKDSWSKKFEDVDVVVHLAARVHIMNDLAENPLDEFRKVNVELTKSLLNACTENGVKKFIFVSTIKVNGERTKSAEIFSENSNVLPVDPYSMSKYEAEENVKMICNQAGMEYIILRPPLIYGGGVGGNLFSLLKLVKSRLPLPLANINNRRSMLYVKNFADIILKCILKKDIANETFLVCDVTISTSKLIKSIAVKMKRLCLLFSLSRNHLDSLLKLVGRDGVADRLYENLEVDNSRVIEKLQWQQPFSFEEGVADMVDWFLKNNN